MILDLLIDIFFEQKYSPQKSQTGFQVSVAGRGSPTEN
jgi:hypothetical protein